MTDVNRVLYVGGLIDVGIGPQRHGQGGGITKQKNTMKDRMYSESGKGRSAMLRMAG